MKNEAVSRSSNWCQIQSGISACVMSSEYFTRTSLYLVRLKIFEWIKFLRRHLHQIQENCAGRNFMTALHVNSQRTCKNVEINLKSTTSNGFNFRIINSLMDSWWVRLTWFDFKTWCCFYHCSQPGCGILNKMTTMFFQLMVVVLSLVK